MSEFQNGTVRVSNDIIDQLIAETALRQEGVYHVQGYANQALEKRRKDGIVAVVENGSIHIALQIIVEDGHNVLHVAQNVQTALARELPTMLGLQAKDIHVIVKSIHYGVSA